MEIKQNQLLNNREIVATLNYGVDKVVISDIPKATHEQLGGIILGDMFETDSDGVLSLNISVINGGKAT